MSLPASADRSPGHDPGLRIRTLSKTFPGTRALDGITLDVPRATIHALLGGNGSGKSTLIKVLAGVETGDPGGSVAFGEHEARSDQVTPAWATAAGLRFVHQDLGLFENLSVAENIYAGQRPPLRAGRIDWKRMRRSAQEVLDRLEITVRAEATLATIAPADRTLVAIARAVPSQEATARSLLVLDEPTSRLAAAETQTLLEALHRYSDQGQTILFVSHRLEEVFDLAATLTVLRDGQLVYTGSAAGLDQPAVVEMMVGDSSPQEQSRSVRRQPESGGATALRVAGLHGGPLEHVDLSVSSGEIVGVAGLVGSGRSEILESIFGARDYGQGVVEVAGEPLPPGRIAAAIKLGVSFVPEDRAGDAMFANLGIPENLSASDSRRYSRRFWFRHARERRDAARMIERMGIRAPRVTSTLDTLSGGNQQKVVLGRWLAMNPTLLLLDEPTQGVDVTARHDLHRQIEATASAGCAVLLVSSDPDELLSLASRVVVLAGGRIVAEASGTGLDHAWLGRHIYAAPSSGEQQASDPAGAVA